jgi:hypothetical protein
MSGADATHWLARRPRDQPQQRVSDRDGCQQRSAEARHEANAPRPHAISVEPGRSSSTAPPNSLSRVVPISCSCRVDLIVSREAFRSIGARADRLRELRRRSGGLRTRSLTSEVAVGGDGYLMRGRVRSRTTCWARTSPSAGLPAGLRRRRVRPPEPRSSCHARSAAAAAAIAGRRRDAPSTARLGTRAAAMTSPYVTTTGADEPRSGSAR